METDTATESTEPQPPSGFCPHCDYPIDPGLCPECGKTVPAEKLRSRSRRQRVRRVAKLVVRIVLIGGLLAGGYWFYRSEIWAQWVPVRIVMQECANARWARQELQRRIYNETADSKTIATIASELMKFQLDVKSPRPKDIPLGIRIIPRTFPVFFKIKLDDYLLLLDESHRLNDWARKGGIWRYSPRSSFNPYTKPITQSLEPGIHQVELSMDVTITITNPITQRAVYAPIKGTINCKTEFEVDDKNVWQHVLPQTVPNSTLTAIEDSIRLGICAVDEEGKLGPNPSAPRLVLIKDSFPCNLDGQISFYKSGQLKESIHTVDDRSHAIYGGWGSSTQPLDCPTLIENPNDLFDARFRSDPGATFEGEKDALPLIEIWWQDVAVKRFPNQAIIQSIGFDTRNEPWMHAPTIVRELTGPPKN